MASVLPVLLSAIRVSPPASGPPHDGKEIGKDVIIYTYKQVSYKLSNSRLLSDLIHIYSRSLFHLPWLPLQQVTSDIANSLSLRARNGPAVFGQNLNLLTRLTGNSRLIQRSTLSVCSLKTNVYRNRTGFWPLRNLLSRHIGSVYTIYWCCLHRSPTAVWYVLSVTSRRAPLSIVDLAGKCLHIVPDSE